MTVWTTFAVSPSIHAIFLIQVGFFLFWFGFVHLAYYMFSTGKSFLQPKKQTNK